MSILSRLRPTSDSTAHFLASHPRVADAVSGPATRATGRHARHLLRKARTEAKKGNLPGALEIATAATRGPAGLGLLAGKTALARARQRRDEQRSPTEHPTSEATSKSLQKKSRNKKCENNKNRKCSKKCGRKALLLLGVGAATAAGVTAWRRYRAANAQAPDATGRISDMENTEIRPMPQEPMPREI